MFKILNKTGFYLNTSRVDVYIYTNELYGTPFYRETCNNVSLLLAIRICKTYGVNLQKLAKKYYKRENQQKGWLYVKQRLKLVDKIEIFDAETGELLLIVGKNHCDVD